MTPLPVTWAVSRDDPVDWRRGRERYGVWVLDVDTSAVRERVAAARSLLADVLWAPAGRQPHITVWVAGFLCGTAALEDDLPPAMLMAQQAALQAAALPPFMLQLGAPDTFDAAAFLHVHDPDSALSRLRAVLQPAGRGEFRETPYVPHVTVGLYRAAMPKAEIQRRLSTWDFAPLTVPVTAVHFVSYAAAVIDGPLHTECSVALSAAVSPR